MTAELTQEEIVTRLLSSNEILKRTKENFYITSPANLGEYLNNLPEEEIDSSKTHLLGEGVEKFKYTFIKDGGWKI